MLATVISYLIAHRLEPDSLYSGWLRRRGELLEHGNDRDVLAGLLVANAYDPAPEVIGEDEPVAEFLNRLGHTGQSAFPVVDAQRHLVGMLTMADLGRVARETRSSESALVARDAARPSEALTLRDSLLEAIRRLGVRGAPALPVVDPKSGRLIGLLSRAHVLAQYERSSLGSASRGNTGESKTERPPSSGIPR
ncbi:MAG: CBS domain-containing protein [Gemmatimonadota bacterium]